MSGVLNVAHMAYSDEQSMSKAMVNFSLTGPKREGSQLVSTLFTTGFCWAHLAQYALFC